MENIILIVLAVFFVWLLVYVQKNDRKHRRKRREIINRIKNRER